MSRVIRAFSLIVLAAVPLLNQPASAADEVTVEIAEYLCKDLMRMPDHERAVSLGVLHGYRLGRKGQTKFNSAVLAKLSNDFVEYCLDHPHEKALASFEKIAK